jgi:CheY-like chemotaxis protein
MASRTLLCVEPEESAVAEIRGVLEPYGFEVTNIPNGEAAIEWARQNAPDLVIVSVEPRKMEYAVCNKLKRSPELQTIPLILTSAEETPQTFEQHKKLRSRADEYMLKPFRTEELLAKVGGLVRLGNRNAPHSGDDDLPAVVGAGGGADNVGPIAVDELSVGDSDIVEEQAALAAQMAKTPMPMGETPNPFRPNLPNVPNIEALEVPAPNPTLDPMFDQETDAAFAALQGPFPASNDVEAPGHDAPWNDEEQTRASAFPAFGDGAFRADAVAAPVSDPPSAAHLSLFDDGHDVPMPDEVSVTSALPLPPPPAVADSRLADLSARIATLENERRALHEQIDDLKLRLQSQPLSKEKEFLSLRETINRKEKDLLDVRDALDAKDRQILDQKDRVREHERARRDLEERMLDFEKSLMAAQERTAALSHDKERASEREKGLKVRLDDALSEIQKAHDEADALKRRLSLNEERQRAETERLREEIEGRLHEAVERHQSEVARLSDERVEAEEDLRTELEGEMQRQKVAHAAELEGVTKRLNDEKSAADERWQAELTQRRKDHEKALIALREEMTAQLTSERQTREETIEAREQAHRGELQGLRRRLDDELASAEERRQRELAEAESRRAADLDTAEQRRRLELQTREEDHHAKLAENDRRHLDETSQLSERHRQELDQVHARVSRAETDLAARTEEISEAQRRLASLATDRDALHADMREREVRLQQLRERNGELEAKSAEYEDQILRAYQKLRMDEKIVDRAKRALAVALNLLDDRGERAVQGSSSGGSGAFAGPTIANPNVITSAAGRAPGEEPG